MAKFESNYVVNVNELYHGKTFKNYKELCNVMGWKASKPADNSGKAQLKALSQYCEWEKVGHKIIITNVFNKKVSIKKNHSPSVILRMTVEKLIIEQLANSTKCDGSERMLISSNNLMVNVGLANRNLKTALNYTNDFAERYGLKKYIVYDILFRSDKNAKDTLNRAIKSLTNQRLIVARNKMGACFGTSLRELTQEQQDYISLKAEKSVMSMFGYGCMSDIFCHGKSSAYEFYDTVVEWIIENVNVVDINGEFINNEDIRKLACMEYYYKLIELSFDKDFIEKAYHQLGSVTDSELDIIKELFSVDELEEYKELGDMYSVSSMNIERNESVAKRRKEEANNGKIKSNSKYKINARLSDEYLEVNKKVNEKCFDVNNKDEYIPDIFLN